jgi:2'-5' RNA ligase
MRLFVALDLPFEMREALSRLCGGLQGARWIPPENTHLTLRFLGETTNIMAEEVDHALAAIRARRFSLALSGTGTSERQGRTVSLWAGVAREPALDHLQTKIETALQRAGVPAERRRFQPAINLARVDNVAPERLGGWVQAHNLLRTEPVPIDHFTLFSSQLGKEQAVYTPEVEYALV